MSKFGKKIKNNFWIKGPKLIILSNKNFPVTSLYRGSRLIFSEFGKCLRLVEIRRINKKN